MALLVLLATTTPPEEEEDTERDRGDGNHSDDWCDDGRDAEQKMEAQVSVSGRNLEKTWRKLTGSTLTLSVSQTRWERSSLCSWTETS